MTYKSVSIGEAISAAEGQVRPVAMPDGSSGVLVVSPQDQSENVLGPFDTQQAEAMTVEKRIERALAIMGLEYDPVWGPQGRPKGGWKAYVEKVYRRAVAGR